MSETLKCLVNQKSDEMVDWANEDDLVQCSDNSSTEINFQNSDSMSTLMHLCSRLCIVNAEIEDLEQRLKTKKELSRHISQESIPTLMDELGVKSLVLENGRKVSIKDEYYAKIPKEKEDNAFKWLEETKNDGIIKSVVSSEFGRGEFEKAIKLVNWMAKQGCQANLKKGVHPMTLKAFIKKRMEEKGDVPLELFGCTPIRVASVK